MGWDIEALWRPREVEEATTDSVTNVAKFLSERLSDPDLIQITIKPRP